MASQEPDQTTSTRPKMLTVQRVLDILRYERRRHLVEILAERPVDDPILLQSLAEKVARAETEETEPRPGTVRRTVVSLYQVHLPYFEEVGAVTTDYSGESVVIPQERLTILADILTDIQSRSEVSPASRRWLDPARVAALFDILRPGRDRESRRIS